MTEALSVFCADPYKLLSDYFAKLSKGGDDKKEESESESESGEDEVRSRPSGTPPHQHAHDHVAFHLVHLVLLHLVRVDHQRGRGATCTQVGSARAESTDYGALSQIARQLGAARLSEGAS